jgi:hypothetical protein
VQGNIIFTPEIRAIFHRNDLIVAHAHVAMGIGVLFMVLSMFTSYISDLKKISFYTTYLLGLGGIFISLSLAGFVEAELLNMNVTTLWILRTVFGFITILSLMFFIQRKYSLSPIQKYNLIGVLSDGFGGIGLILLSSFIYPLLGFSFSGTYEYIVFSFVTMTGLLHFMALKYKEHEIILTDITIIIRVFISSVFFALFMSKTLGLEAFLISAFDISFVLVYLIFFYQKESLCKN